MNKQCVICGEIFDARGRAKACSPKCSKKLASEWQLRKYHSDPRYREFNNRARRKAIVERKMDPVKRAKYQEYHRERQRELAATDPEYRRRKKASTERSLRRRLLQDPDLKKRENRNNLRKRQELKAIAQLAAIATQLEAKK